VLSYEEITFDQTINMQIMFTSFIIILIDGFIFDIKISFRVFLINKEQYKAKYSFFFNTKIKNH